MRTSVRVVDRRPDTSSTPNAPRGGLARSVLEELVQEGLSARGIAQRTGFSATAVRYWLAKHGLTTRRAARPGLGRADAQVGTVIRDCSRHGESEFVARPDGYLRCRRCRSEAVSDRRRRVKSSLVEEAGGACAICGYARSAAALHFHQSIRTGSRSVSEPGEWHGLSNTPAQKQESASSYARTAMLSSRPGT